MRSFNQRAANFGPDAWRTAANWSVDWSWWAADPRERELSDRLQAFFASQGMDTYGNRFTLDGTRLSDAHSTALVATNAVASLAATNPRAAQFVAALWKRGHSVGPVPLLRRPVVPDGIDALRRRVPHLDPGVGRQPLNREAPRGCGGRLARAWR